MPEVADVVVIGAGQAGLALSYHLGRSRIPHAVLERGRIGDSWRTQRWDSFHLNTPNWSNALPGAPFHREAPDAFAECAQLVSSFEDYVRRFRLPVREHTAVTEVAPRRGGYAVKVEGAILHARAVVLASGSMSRPKIPEIARGLPGEILSLSAGTHRNAASLPPGAVLVVGSGQSGCQIAEDLLEAGRRVFVSASRVGRVPRVYRGRDILAWWRDMGFLDARLEELEDPATQFATQPQVSGTQGGHTVSLHSLARDGATLLGRVVDVDSHVLRLGQDLREAIAFADDKARAFKSAVDSYIDREGIAAVAPAPDPGEPPLPSFERDEELATLDLHRAGVSTVIWCTGFTTDWRWVKADVFDERGLPKHRGGVTGQPGLYILGLPWLSKRKSGILYGVGEDAERIVRHIEQYLISPQPSL